jgi:hypothetical protein
MLQRLGADARILSRWAPSILLALILCAGPLWLWWAPLRSFFLKSDDFVYVARSRTPAALRSYLLRPHNGHVVPLFRLETYALARLAGSLEALPTVLSWASYATLVLAMSAAGHVVARESGRTSLGLAAMAALGLTSVLGPTLLWYSAGQALAAGMMVLAMLAALQAWRVGGAGWALALGLLAAIAAPLLWSGGYAAGPVGIAYLWADGRRRARRAAVILAVTSLLMVGLVWSIAGRGFSPAAHVASQPAGDVLPLPAMVAHTAQAVCEALVLNNVGLDATTTSAQAILFCALLAALWWRSRRRSAAASPRRRPRPNPLESAGAALVIITFGLIFSARGTESDFDSLRALGWYDAMGELGAVLFVCGWCSGDLPSPPTAAPMPPGRNELLYVVLFAAVMLALQAPRADRVVFEYDEMAAPLGPTSSRSAAVRTPGDLATQAKTQRESLAALDRLESAVRRGEFDRAAIRRAIERANVPGMPTHLLDFDPTDLLAISGNSTDPRVSGGDRR